MAKMSKKIPLGIMHEPKPMVWAEATPLSEHKERQKKGVTVVNGTRRDPLPLSRATTDLRRAYPYIFDCAAYAKTHAPEKIETDLFYSRFTMPYEIFLDYCLDTCTEQTDYLKNEIYKLMAGQPAKYIKVSPDRTVFAQPVVIAFSHTDLKTGKEKRIHNIGHDARVDTVQVQILKELLDVSHGYLNLPKAFYAKTRRIFNTMKHNIDVILNHKDYRGIINSVKNFTALSGNKINTQEAIKMFQVLQEQGKQLESLEQGGYYAVYLAFEYILANKKSGIKNQSYRFLDLCEKCAPTLIKTINDKPYFKNKNEAGAFMGTLQTFALLLSSEKSIGINSIETGSKNDDISITVYFN